MRAGMRREDDVRQILERRIDERLLLKGVQTQTAELAGADAPEAPQAVRPSSRARIFLLIVHFLQY